MKLKYNPKSAASIVRAVILALLQVDFPKITFEKVDSTEKINLETVWAESKEEYRKQAKERKEAGKNALGKFIFSMLNAPTVAYLLGSGHAKYKGTHELKAKSIESYILTEYSDLSNYTEFYKVQQLIDGSAPSLEKAFKEAVATGKATYLFLKKFKKENGGLLPSDLLGTIEKLEKALNEVQSKLTELGDLKAQIEEYALKIARLEEGNKVLANTNDEVKKKNAELMKKIKELEAIDVDALKTQLNEALEAKENAATIIQEKNEEIAKLQVATKKTATKKA